MEIRKAVEADIPNLLPLMRQLAEFEKYADDFAVTEHVLREQGFHRSPPDFHCLVAEEGSDLIGFLVYHFIAFTYRAKPNLIIKELYIAGPHRSRGVGKLLMKAVAKRGRLTVVAWTKGGSRSGMSVALSFTSSSVQKSIATGTNSNCQKKRFGIWPHRPRNPAESP